MAEVFEGIDDRLRAFIEAQRMFFVATAPSGDGGHINLSPKGGNGLFRVTGPLGFAYVDLMGSGIETIAHLQRERPHRGHVLRVRGSAEDRATARRRAAGASRTTRASRSCWRPSTSRRSNGSPCGRWCASRSTRVGDSCGFVVPRMDYVGERDQLYRYADNRLRKIGPEAVEEYVSANNAESIDGLPGLEPLVDGRLSLPAVASCRRTATG